MKHKPYKMQNTRSGTRDHDCNISQWITQHAFSWVALLLQPTNNNKKITLKNKQTKQGAIVKESS